MGKSLFWYGSELLFAFFLAETLGLEPKEMGVVLALGLLASAGVDLAVGHALGLTRFDAQAAARLQLIGALLCAVTFAAVFLGFWMPGQLQLAYAIVIGLAFRITYGLYDVAQNALMALATQDRSARDRIASTRLWFSGLATLLVAVAIGPLIAAQGQAAAKLYVGLAIAIAVPAIISAGLLERRLMRLRVQDEVVVSTHVLPRDDGTTPPSGLLWLLMALMLVTSLTTPVFHKVEPFFAAYVLRSPLWGGLVIIGMAAGIVAGQPLWRLVCERSSHVMALWIAAGLQLLSLGVFAVLPPGWTFGFVAAAFVFGLGNGGVGMVLWAAFSDVVAREANGSESIAYGRFTAMAKTALAIGGFSIGLALDRLDYRDSQSQGLITLMTGAPAVGAVLCLIMGLAWSRQAARAKLTDRLG